MTAAAPQTVTAKRVREFAAAVLGRVGMSLEDSWIVADALLWADLRGITSQGIAKLPLIVERLRSGGSRPGARVRTVSESASFAVLDAGEAWGHVAGVRAMRIAIAKAKAMGVGAVVVGRTDSGSAMGYYATLATRERLVGLAINDGVALMPPTGGTTKVVGNQAFALGCPAGRHAPLLFDSALSAISWTQIDELRDHGEPLAAGLALNARGEPTRDHAEALTGILLPIGGHRGFGLALIWEVLTGVLSGNQRFATTITPLADVARPQSVAHFYLAIDPAVAMPFEAFIARIDALIDQVHASPPATGVDRIRVPGEQGFAIAARREREGIPVAAERAAQLAKLGEDLGVSW